MKFPNFSRLGVSLPEDVAARVGVSAVDLEMPATDLPGLKDVRWFVLILASASLALYPVHTAGKSFGASPTKLAFQFAKLLVAWLTDSVEKRLEVTKPAKALRQIMLAGICLTLVAVDTEHSWICASAGKRGAKPHGLTYSR